MNPTRTATALFFLALLGACAAPPVVRQQDLDAWAGVPVEALDTHPFFVTLPQVRTLVEGGIEVRDYVNKRYVAGCLSGGANNKVYTMNASMYKAFRACSANMSGCDNVFYIKSGVVTQFAPTGQCKTSEVVQPQGRYERSKAP